MRSVFFNVFQNLIVVLYVFDNDTNFVIRMSTFVGLGIEIWKVTKVQDVSFDFENKLFGLIPRIQLEDKKDYEDSGTKEFDRMAFKYLGMLCFPLAFCYCIYSVIYNEHKVVQQYSQFEKDISFCFRDGTASSWGPCTGFF